MLTSLPDSDKLEHQRALARARSARWRKANPEYHKEWSRANLEKGRASTRRWRANNREKYLLSQRQSNYRAKWGMGLEQIEALIEAQGGVCPICAVVLVLGGKDGAHVDHNHQTGQIRGVLCCNCNTGIGKLRDDPQLLMAAIRYIDADLIT